MIKKTIKGILKW